MTRRRDPAEPPDEYWVDWLVLQGMRGWQIGLMHWQKDQETMHCGAEKPGGMCLHSVQGVKALDSQPVPYPKRCKKCFRRWLKHHAALWLKRRQAKAALEAKRWDKKWQPLIRYLKMF